jgi:hypothetical protein
MAVNIEAGAFIGLLRRLGTLGGAGADWLVAAAEQFRFADPNAIGSAGLSVDGGQALPAIESGLGKPGVATV